MKNRLKTSKHTDDILNELEFKFNLPRNIILRISIALSLTDDNQQVKVFNDQQGLELSRSTLTGEFDSLFKGLISVKKRKKIDDNEYFKEMKYHCDRGVILLKNIYDFEGDLEKVIYNLCNLKSDKIT